MTRGRKALLVVALLAAGYLAGVATPAVLAYTDNQITLLNRISTDLRGINRSLQLIARKLK